MRSTTTQPACSPIATAILPVSARVRLKISPTISHDRNASNTSAGWPKGANERSQQVEAAAPADVRRRDSGLGEEMQHGEQRRGEQRGHPRSRFAFDRRMHDAAKHGFLDQRDGDAGTQADEENAREAQPPRARSPVHARAGACAARTRRRRRPWRCRSLPTAGSP